MPSSVTDAPFAIASWTTIGVLAVLLVIHMIAFRRFHAKYAGAETFDGHMGGYRPSDAKRILEPFAQRGLLDTYLRQELLVDLTFPIVYSLLLAALIAMAALRVANAARWWALLPFATAAADYFENFAVISMIRSYEPGKENYGTAAVVASVATRLKWLLLGASLAAVVILWAAAIYRGMR